MTHSTACTLLLKEFEGLRLTVGVDTDNVPLVGYGHDDFSLKVGDVITLAQAESFLADDLADVESFLNRVISRPLTQGQFDALCDFVYNVGSKTFYESKLLGLVNESRDDLAADDLLRFDHDSNGRILPGLSKRRFAERKMYLGV